MVVGGCRFVAADIELPLLLLLMVAGEAKELVQISTADVMADHQDKQETTLKPQSRQQQQAAAQSTASDPDDSANQTSQMVTSRTPSQLQQQAQHWKVASHVGCCSKRHRTTFTQLQLNILEESFKQNNYPSPSYREALAIKTSLDPSRIQVWFQNRRAKEKKHLNQAMRCIVASTSVHQHQQQQSHKQQQQRLLLNQNLASCHHHEKSSNSTAASRQQQHMVLDLHLSNIQEQQQRQICNDVLAIATGTNSAAEPTLAAHNQQPSYASELLSTVGLADDAVNGSGQELMADFEPAADDPNLSQSIEMATMAAASVASATIAANITTTTTLTSTSATSVNIGQQHQEQQNGTGSLLCNQRWPFNCGSLAIAAAGQHHQQTRTMSFDVQRANEQSSTATATANQLMMASLSESNLDQLKTTIKQELSDCSDHLFSSTSFTDISSFSSSHTRDSSGIIPQLEPQQSLFLLRNQNQQLAYTQNQHHKQQDYVGQQQQQHSHHQQHQLHQPSLFGGSIHDQTSHHHEGQSRGQDRDSPTASYGAKQSANFCQQLNDQLIAAVAATASTGAAVLVSTPNSHMVAPAYADSIGKLQRAAAAAAVTEAALVAAAAHKAQQQQAVSIHQFQSNSQQHQSNGYQEQQQQQLRQQQHQMRSQSSYYSAGSDLTEYQKQSMINYALVNSRTFPSSAAEHPSV